MIKILALFALGMDIEASLAKPPKKVTCLNTGKVRAFIDLLPAAQDLESYSRSTPK